MHEVTRRRSAAAFLRHLAAAGLVLLLLFAQPVAAQAEGDQVVARVNDFPITVERFNASYVTHLIQTGQNDTPHRRYVHLNDLVDAYLLADEARRRGMEDAAYQEYVDREIKKTVGGRFFEIAFADSFPDPPDADVREAFRREKEKVVVRHLFFNNPAQAEAAHERLRNGEDFVALANEVFETAAFDSSAGNLGQAGYWQLDDAFAEAAFSLSVGEYSEPVRSRFGWHIIRLENRFFNPLLTESEYERRRKDVGNQLHARRFRLEGTRFVRAFMESLDIHVNVEAMGALRQVILSSLTESPEAAAPKLALERDEVVAIEEGFSPESVLATYELDGGRHDFTAADFFGWLGDLPYGEVRNSTAASVGRALRNHVLAERGLSLGLQEDEVVRYEVGHRAALFLADRFRTRLRQEANVNLTDEEVQQAYEQMGFRKLKQAEADFWQIRFESLHEAEAARDAVLEEKMLPATYPSYAAIESGDLREIGELGTYVQKAPIDTPVVIGTGDGAWYVVEISRRDVAYTSIDDVREEITASLRPYVSEVRTLRELRAQADVEIDTELFEEMMKLSSSSTTSNS